MEAMSVEVRPRYGAVVPRVGRVFELNGGPGSKPPFWMLAEFCKCEGRAWTRSGLVMIAALHHAAWSFPIEMIKVCSIQPGRLTAA